MKTLFNRIKETVVKGYNFIKEFFSNNKKELKDAAIVTVFSGITFSLASKFLSAKLAVLLFVGVPVLFAIVSLISTLLFARSMSKCFSIEEQDTLK